MPLQDQHNAGVWLLALIFAASAHGTHAAEPVTVDNFVRAETDTYMRSYVDRGGLGRLHHIRDPTPIDKQDVIRMNRDTLYSIGVFDLNAGPVTINKPDAEGRFQSIQVISQDHYTTRVVYEPGPITLTPDELGTRYAVAIVRTFVDAASDEDVHAANAVQDATTVEQAARGDFDVPDWDAESHKRLRNAINVLAATVNSTDGMFGPKGEVDPVRRLLGAAYGWGGNPETEATYVNFVPERNDGRTPHTLTVRDVPVDGFWSITVYNKDGFMEPNDQDSYAFNNVTASKNADGSVTINFGRGPDATNNIPITPGWNYIVRLYRPRAEILQGTWTFPDAEPVQ